MSLRRSILLILTWTSILALFTVHYILTKHDDHTNAILHGHTKKNVIPNNIDDDDDDDIAANNDNMGQTMNIKRDRNDCIQRITAVDARNANDNNSRTEIDYGEGISPQQQQQLRESSVSMTRFLEEKSKQKMLRTENQKLKSDVEKLTKHVEELEQKRRQLKLLVRRLAVIEKGKEHFPKLDPALPWVFAITPTFTRYTQKADLIRLSQTLQHVANFHWIIVEDSKESTQLVRNVLLDSGLSFTHLNARTPSVMQRKKGEKYNKHHRGVTQRNLGLKWIRQNVNPEQTPGVVYFMDDDNTYHKLIFDEMRWTKNVSVWPVALTGGARWAGPVVSDGKVVRFHTNWAKDRKFPIDMAAFAVNLNVLIKKYPNAKFDDSVKRGYLEPTFLSTITTVDQLEPLADNCTKILVWHTRTDLPQESIKGEKKLIAAGTPSNPAIET